MKNGSLLAAAGAEPELPAGVATLAEGMEWVLSNDGLG
jgi:hypothetical protein